MADQSFFNDLKTVINFKRRWVISIYTDSVTTGFSFYPKTKFSLLIPFLIVLVSSCQKDVITDPLPKTIEPYTFFAAGHTYGSPGTDNAGFHPPFTAKFNLINKRNIDLGFLLGDIVNIGSAKNWDEVDSVLNYLDNETYFAVGNHDMTDRTLFESRYGKTYFNFKHNEDLFIVLDPNIDQWNILGEQLNFLQDVLDKESNEARNVFVLFHQLIWIDRKNNKYSTVAPNSFEGRADTINFWTEVEPLFNALPNEVYMFAGDIGAAHWSDDAMYDHYDNITFIATGMGEGVGDNFVFIDVDATGKVSFELISLNEDDIHAMGNIEDYQVP